MKLVQKIRDFSWPAWRVFILGTGGNGKSTLQRFILERQKANYYFIFDHKHEFGTLLKKPYCYTREGLVKQTARGGYVVYDPCHEYPNDRETAFKVFCEFVYDVAGWLPGRKILVVDEVHFFMEPGKRPDEFLKIMQDGRNFKLDVLACGQASNEINNRVRQQITDAFVFRHQDTNAVKFLASNGYDETELRNLKPGEFIWRNFNTGETRKGGKEFKIQSSGGGTFVHIGERLALENGSGKNAVQHKHREIPRAQLARKSRSADRPSSVR